MAPEIKISGVSVVFLGSFAPTVFHPSWFERNNLMAKPEADAAQIDVIHADIANFRTEWLVLNVTQDRFSATCTRTDSVSLLRDLILGTFQLFSQLPMTAFGINNHFHFQLQNELAWHAFGHKMAPKEPWNGLLEKPGMLSVNMRGIRPDARRGNINVTVQPSVQVKFGAFVQVNDHFDVANDKTAISAGDAAKIFHLVWNESLDRAAKIAKGLVA